MMNCVILPIGSTEQHGPHLPVGTDHLNVWEIAVKVAEKVDGIVLPPLLYGCSSEHFPRSGTLSLNPQTLKLTIKDIIESLTINRVKNVIILNGHGGQFNTVEEAISELKTDEKFKQVKILHLSHFNILPLELLAKEIPLKEEAFVHAEELETSIMLALNSKIVKWKNIKKEIPEWIPKGLTGENAKSVRRILKTKFIGRDTETGIIGDPTLASKAKGKRAIQILSSALAKTIKKEIR